MTRDPTAEPHATLVLLRHGESKGNAEGSFAGWRDVALTPRGRDQAHGAGLLLAKLVRRIDLVFTSVLQRATDTAEIALAAADARTVPRLPRWRLNERHCGSLQGRSKAEVKQQLGREVLRAFRSWSIAPEPVAAGSSDDPRTDSRYRDIADPLPRSESLRDMAARVDVAWRAEIEPALRGGRSVLVVGHALALRALARPLEGITEERLPEWLLGNAGLRCYRLGEQLRILGVVEDGAGHGTDE